MKAAFAAQPALVAYAHALLSDHAAAEDAVQNAMLVVTRKYEQYEEGTSILAWCRAIVRLEVLRQLRDRSRERTLEDRLLHDAVDAAFERAHAERQSLRVEALRGCLNRLSRQSREIVRLRYEEGLGYQAIASATGMTLEAVRKSLYRLKTQLRGCLELQRGETA